AAPEEGERPWTPEELPGWELREGPGGELREQAAHALDEEGWEVDGAQLLELVGRIAGTAESLGEMLSEHGAAVPAEERRGLVRDLTNVAHNLDALVLGVQKAVGPERLAG